MQIIDKLSSPYRHTLYDTYTQESKFIIDGMPSLNLTITDGQQLKVRGHLPTGHLPTSETDSCPPGRGHLPTKNYRYEIKFYAEYAAS